MEYRKPNFDRVTSRLDLIEGIRNVFLPNLIPPPSSSGASVQTTEDNRLCLSKGRTNNEYYDKRLCQIWIGNAAKSLVILISIPSSVSTHFLSEAVTTAVGEVAEAGEDGFDLGPNRILHVQIQNLGGKFEFF